MYHAIILEDILDLINLGNVYPGTVSDEQLSRWKTTATIMQAWLQNLTHPDGEIALFNDAAMGIAASPADIEVYRQRLELPASSEPTDGISHLSASGYVRVQRSGMVAMLDIGPVGPTYLPGHAHADTLSFELSLAGRRVFVNSGTSLYGVNAERQRQRSTAAHNTLEIDDENSSEVWGSFRVARRATPFNLEITDDDHTSTIACSHDGYMRLPGRVTHRREWTFTAHSLTVQDRLEGQYHKAVARFHAHPDYIVEGSGTSGRLRHADGAQLNWEIEGGNARVIPTTWHPQFGLSCPNSAIEITLLRPNCTIKFSW